MSRPVNAKQVKIRNISQFVNESLQYEDTVIFQGRAQIVQIHGKNRQDGTQDLDYIAKCDLVDVQKAQSDVDVPKSVTDDKQIKEKSQSQALRQKAYVIARNLGESPEELYKSAIEEASSWLDNYQENKMWEHNG